jgi:FtsP/CotA-like multicopper oxidase with cupredoxin domain
MDRRQLLHTLLLWLQCKRFLQSRSLARYNGTVPGPTLRLKEGVAVTIDLVNETQVPEFVHWHGLSTSVAVDGSEEERSPVLAPGAYSGQYGFLYVEAKRDPGRYDQEVFLAGRHREPTILHRGDPDNNWPGVWVPGATRDQDRAGGMGLFAAPSAAPSRPEPDGHFQLEFAMLPDNGQPFNRWTVNGKSWPDVDPIRVKKGKRDRIALKNGNEDGHPVHLHRHLFEAVKIGEAPLSGLIQYGS